MKVFLNPASGTREALAAWERVKRGLAPSQQAEAEVHLLAARGHAQTLGATLDFAPREPVLVFGGDGTIHELLVGLREQQHGEVVLFPFPAGSGNALCQSLGLFDYARAERALCAFLAGGGESSRLKQLPVMRVRAGSIDTLAFAVVSVGMHANLVHWSNSPWWRWMGTLRFQILGVLGYLLQPALALKVKFLEYRAHSAEGRSEPVPVFEKQVDDSAYFLASPLSTLERHFRLLPFARTGQRRMHLVEMTLRRMTFSRFVEFIQAVYAYGSKFEEAPSQARPPHFDYEDFVQSSDAAGCRVEVARVAKRAWWVPPLSLKSVAMCVDGETEWVRAGDAVDLVFDAGVRGTVVLVVIGHREIS